MCIRIYFLTRMYFLHCAVFQQIVQKNECCNHYRGSICTQSTFCMSQNSVSRICLVMVPILIIVWHFRCLTVSFFFVNYRGWRCPFARGYPTGWFHPVDVQCPWSFVRSANAGPWICQACGQSSKVTLLRHCISLWIGSARPRTSLGRPWPCRIRIRRSS